MVMQRDFKGVWIPKEVWLDERLSALDKIIFVEIDSLDSDVRGCYASNKYLAEFCQCSETKISKAISKLIDLGYLYVQKFDGRQRELKSSLAKSARLNNKKYEAAEQKMQESNIYNNTTNNTKERKKEITPNEVTMLPNVTQKRKTESKPTFDELIDNYTNNNELRAELKEHLKTRKAKKATLTNRAIELSLKKLDSLTANDAEKILIVQKAIESGWTTFYPLKPDEKPQKKASYNLNEYEELTQDEIIAKLYG
jgi:hypothetical protein